MAGRNKKAKEEKPPPEMAEAKIHCDEAAGYLKNGNYHKALSSYNQALELNPGEKGALVARSKCYLLLGEPKLALDDAETALKIDKGYIKAIYQKAEALYFLGDFELSLMFYHRGLRIRPELEGFRLGIQKAQEAIENTIGSSKPLIDLKAMATLEMPSSAASPESSNLTATRVEQQQQQQQQQAKAPTPSDSRSRMSKGGGTAVDKKLSRQLLGRLCVDKEYLEGLLSNPNLIGDALNGECVVAQAREAVEFLNKRQEFWRQQRPTTTTTTRKKSSKRCASSVTSSKKINS